ncbi:CST complex subunit STN1 [Austrofundulus limnaeus]|uniref:CST complex subunit STN1 n=1 Tax=Austrofundulus limnaeus TaxID=52670 RepID=A0A2I4C179_AUSLI|nr:PREDICTED: CST complex subunit STN1 [Austrofundulus limnaeus]
MQTKAMDPTEEPPSILWGLDPIFSAFSRLYVKDILQMTESIQVPGVYFYNKHPIYKVDVLGTVVYRRERDDFFCYGVDDGTGVINCMCWKSKLLKDADKSGGNRGDGVQRGLDLAAELKKLRESHHKRCQLEIGDVLRVRGSVKTFRQQREIKAATFYKVDDPVMAAQIARMMEVPQLYRAFYDKPFHFQADAEGNSACSSLNKATKTIKDFLKQKSVTRFRPYDVLELLEPLIANKPRTGTAEQEAAAGPTACQQLRQLLTEVLQILQDEGVVYRKVKSQDEVYNVTAQDKDLLMAVKDIIREDCRRAKFAETGCHVLHILSVARQRHSLNLSRAALDLVLKELECNSEVVSTSDNRYTMF